MFSVSLITNLASVGESIETEKRGILSRPLEKLKFKKEQFTYLGKYKQI